MFHAKVLITLRRSILDPQGKAVEHGMHSLGLTSVEHVRVGKVIEFDVRVESREEAERVTREACNKLLANPVMEDFTFTLDHIQTPAHV